MFKAKTHRCSVTDGEETFEFFVKEPSGREILEQAQKATERKRKNIPDPTTIENARETFTRFVVHEDGSPISGDEVEEMLDMRFSAMQQVTDVVLEKTGLSKAVEAAKKA